MNNQKRFLNSMKNLKAKGLLKKGQAYLEKLIQVNNSETVLKQSRVWARSISWTLMGGTFFGIVWLGTAKTEEIVVANGKLEPISGVVDVQMPIQGIAKKINIKEGQIVEKGQVLIQLDTEASEEKMKTASEALELKKRELVLKKEELLKTQALARAKNRILTSSKELAHTIMKKFENLQIEGAASELQYLESKDRLEKVEGEIISTELESERQLSVLEQNIKNIQAQIADLKSLKTEAEVTLRYQGITSPVSGVVFDLKALTPGFVARSTEPIMKIVPIEELQANVEVESKHIGFIRNGIPADISIDSFPATDFGVIGGVVSQIGSDALPPDPREAKGYRYPTIIQLDEQSLILKSGKTLPLQVGMSLTANIKLRKVTYLQLLLGSFKDKADSLRSL